MKETPEEITNKMQEIAGNPVSHREQKLATWIKDLRRENTGLREHILEMGKDLDEARGGGEG
jgi:hypothetical protein